MLKGYKILTSFCVICATLYGGAYGAASVRGGATSRAGSIRTLGAGTTASVKTTTSRTQPTTTAANANTESTESVGGMRMSHATGLGGSKLPGKISGTTTSTSGESQNVAELRQAIEQLRNDYDALGEQYNNLLGDVSNVSDTAQVAHETATNNTNTLTVVRSDLSVAKSDIEDLKAAGGFDEERVQGVLDTTLAQRNYATRGELAATDAVARGAVQVADLPQTLNALNIADKDYVASRTQGVVNDSLNITLENYYTKGQVNAAIDVAKTGMVDKNYVDNQIDGLAPKTYVDNRVASIQTGVSEGAVQGIINNSIDTRLENYYTKGDIDDAIVDAIGAAKDGMADRDYVDNQVRDMASTEYVDTKVAEIESGVDAGTLYNILETRGYKTGTEVQGIVNDSINNTVANYYTKSQVDNAINVAKNGMADRNYVDNQIDGLAPKNWVNTVVDAKVNALPLGLGRDAVKAVVEEYGYKDELGVREIMNTSGYVKTSELPDLVKQWAPGAEIQYADGKLYFVDKDGNDRVVDIRGLDGQDGDQVELQRNGDAIVWRYVSGDDQSWHNLVNMSDLRGADGKSVELGVMNNNLVWKKEGESGWQYLYDLGSITGTDGCGVKAETTNTANGMMVKLLKDCAGQTGDGQLLTQFEVLNGADGTVSEEQIVGALESNPTFMQLKKNVQDLSDGLNNTNSQVNELSDRVDNNTTGLVATNTLANNAWNKVKDLESSNKTAREYVDDRIGDLGFDLLTRRNYASVAAKLGAIDDTKTVAEYINAQISKINTSIRVESGDDGITYICKTGNNCTTNPNPYTGDWARISVDVSGYLTRAEADDSFAPIGIVGAVTTAQDAATQAQTQASQAWGKLSDLGGDTVKGYVDNTINGRVGFLGINLYNGEDYSVADKLGFTATPGTVKEYIDKAVSSVNTKIRVERSPYDGKTYICKNGDTCASQPGPYSTDEWAPVSVDMSGYLTENDADKLYAPIATKTTAESAASVAAAAQTAASEAKTKADDSWNKLSDLGYQTVRQYVEEKLEDISTSGGNGVSIRVETGSDGYTYICTATSSDCRDLPSSTSSYWRKIEFNIPSEYLTETEGNDLYALKTQIGALGGSFSSVADKIGLNNSNDWTNSNKSVKQYVDDKFSSISTDIQVETGTDGFTYICKTGNNCHLPIASYPSEWAKVNVDLGNLGTNPSSGQAYNVATKIGLTDSTNINKTVVQYITEKIGNLGNYTDSYNYTQPYSVLTYLQANYTPKVTIGDLGKPSSGGSDYTVAEKIGLTGANSSKTVYSYIGDRIGDIGVDSSSYQPKSVKQYLTETYVPLATIGNLGYPIYSSTPYTVAEKIGLNSTTDSSKTVKQYVDGLIGTSSLGTYDNVIAYGNANYAPKSEFDTLSSTVSGHTTLLSGLGNGVTVKDYVDSKTPNIQIAPGSNGKMYYCTLATRCNTDYLDTAHGWQEFDISESLNLSTYLKVSDAANTYLTIADAANTYASKSVESAVNNETTGLSATRILASSASAAAATADTKAGNAATAAETAQNTANTANTTANNAWDKVKGLNEVSGLSDKTVTGYVDYRLGDITGTVKTYVDSKVESGGVQVETFGNKTYICSNNCTTTPPCSYPNQCGWQELDIDVSSKAEQSDMTAVQNILAGFGGENEPDTVMNYIGDMGNYQSGWQDVPYTVASKIGLNSGDDAKKSVKQYIADRLGFTDDDANKTVAQYIAEHAASGGVQVQTVSGTTYICSENCDGVGTPPCADGTYPSTCGWQKLEVNLNGYATEQYVDDAIGTLGGNYTNVGDKINISSGTVKSYVDAVDNRIGNLGGRMVDSERKPYTVSEKLGLPQSYSDETVVEYIVDYVAANAASGGVTVKTVTNNGVSETYICSKNCESTPPCQVSDTPDTCGWQKLEVDLSQYLKSSEAESTYLKQNDIKLKRDGKGIKIWGGGIAESNAYKVADVEDLMCASYRMEPLVPGDEGYDANRESFQLICNTNE